MAMYFWWFICFLVSVGRWYESEYGLSSPERWRDISYGLYKSRHKWQSLTSHSVTWHTVTWHIVTSHTCCFISSQRSLGTSTRSVLVINIVILIAVCERRTWEDYIQSKQAPSLFCAKSLDSDIILDNLRQQCMDIFLRLSLLAHFIIWNFYIIFTLYVHNEHD